MSSFGERREKTYGLKTRRSGLLAAMDLGIKMLH